MNLVVIWSKKADYMKFLSKCNNGQTSLLSSVYSLLSKPSLSSDIEQCIMGITYSLLITVKAKTDESDKKKSG